MDHNLESADRAATINKEISFLRKPKRLAQALREAQAPLTRQQQRIKEGVEAKGLIYAVNGNGVGCVFKRRES